jgi:hypothetical protein
MSGTKGFGKVVAVAVAVAVAEEADMMNEWITDEAGRQTEKPKVGKKEDDSFCLILSRDCLMCRQKSTKFRTLKITEKKQLTDKNQQQKKYARRQPFTRGDWRRWQRRRS